MNYYDALANDLRLALAHYSEWHPPLIVAWCVCGTNGDKWDYFLSVCLPSLSTVVEWQMEPDKEILEILANCKSQNLIPSVAMRFFVPAVVIEKNGIRDAVRCCIEHIEAAVSGKTPIDESVMGVPVSHVFLMEGN
jgi:hypothetical protein